MTDEQKRIMIEKVKATKKKRGSYYPKFTYEQAETMRHLVENKLLKQVDIMKKFDISKFTLSKILNNEIYTKDNPTHLKGLPNFEDYNVTKSKNDDNV